MSEPRDPLLGLDDYVSGAMPDAEAEGWEEDLFEAASLSEPAEWLDALARRGAYLARRNAFNPGLTQAEVDASLRSGRRITVVDAWAAAAVGRFELPRSSEQVIYRFEADVRGIQQIDVELYAGAHLMKVIRDLEFEAESGVVYLCCETTLARFALEARATSRVIAYVDGERRTLAIFDTVGQLTGD